MSTFLLEAESRPMELSVSQFRRERKVPAVFYGKGQNTLHLLLNRGDFVATYKKAGETNLIDLNVDGNKKYKVLVHTIQIHPVTDEVLHVDLKNVRMDQKLVTRVPVEALGLPPAVKELFGSLSLVTSEIEIRCLPDDLLHKIEVDVTVLKTFHDSIHVSDLNLGDKIEILTDKSRVIATVLAPKKEEETTPAPVTAVVGETPVEGAAANAAEGAATPAGEAASKTPKKEEKKK